jgi:hypothetical protein
VGNQAGFNEHFPFNVEGRRQASSWFDEFEKVVRDAVPANDGKRPSVTFTRLDDLHMIEDATETHARWARKASKRFRKRPADTSSVMALPRPAGYQTPPRYIWASPGAGRIDSADAPLTYEELQAAHATAARTMRRTQPCPPPLAHDWEDFLYTDGSHVTGPCLEGPGIGAAVHVPGLDCHTLAVHCAWQEEGADTTCNTICSAELAALHMALTQYGNTHTRIDGTLRGHGQPGVHVRNSQDDHKATRPQGT